MPSFQAPPVAMTIAGSDSSAGAGLQADLKAMAAFDVHGLTAVSSIVSEVPGHVSMMEECPPSLLIDQVTVMQKHYPIAAYKTGLLPSKRHIVATYECLKEIDVPLVIDPVMVASSGHPFLNKEAIEAYRERLLPLATLITPNLPEAQILLDDEETSPEKLAEQLSQRFHLSVLVKGGHYEGDSCTDTLYHNGQFHHFEAPRLDVPGSHGTGCTLSAAITAQLAHGKSLPEAINSAKQYLTQTLASGFYWSEHQTFALNQIKPLE